MRSRSRIEQAKPKYTGSFDYHGAFAAAGGPDNAFSVDAFVKGLSITIQSKTEEEIIFGAAHRPNPAFYLP